MAKLTGMGGSITVSATAYAVSEWSGTVSNELQDVTDTASGGWVNRIASVSSADITFRAWWGSSVALLSSTFASGTKVTASLAVGNSTVTMSGGFFVESITITNNAKGAVEFQCTAKSDGAVTIAATP
jgi:predicted secreted protein